MEGIYLHASMKGRDLFTWKYKRKVYISMEV